MDALHEPVASPRRLDTRKPLSLAVLAMGGQGGGVLVDWIVGLAESQGYFAQSTSVPGVAQRTGATIYYVEMIASDGSGRRPVLSLMPAPGEVDIVIGAELMEAGRAIQRGLVSAERTTLITSSHRAYATIEKMAPGDGIRDSAKIHEIALATSKRFIAFDMAAIAEETGSVISAALFGALAASGALPFPRRAYEATIEAAGLAVRESLGCFSRSYERAQAMPAGAPPSASLPASDAKRFPQLQPVGNAAVDGVIERARTRLPEAAHPMVAAGLARVLDFQDVDYAREYLDLLEPFAEVEARSGGTGSFLTRAAAKQIARAMAYDDVIRVADLKTRGSRFDRVKAEVAAKPGQIVYMTEFMHPRMEEVCATLPARVGLWIETHPRVFAALQRVINRGRRIRTATAGSFVLLYLLAGMRRYRRGTLRHRREVAHRNAWLEQARAAAQRDLALAVEILEARRLVKGYSDTHARGLTKFATVIGMARRLEGRADAADWVRRLRQAALADADGASLGGVVKTIESFL